MPCVPFEKQKRLNEPTYLLTTTMRGSPAWAFIPDRNDASFGAVRLRLISLRLTSCLVFFTKKLSQGNLRESGGAASPAGKRYPQ